MARTALGLVALLMLGACGSKGVTAAPPGSPAARLAIDAGQPFQLQPGQVAAVAAGGASAGDGLRVGFDGVGSDSRCPKGEQCVWAGDATLRVWLQARGGPRHDGEVHTAQGRARSFTAAGHTLQLVRLDPAPISGRALAASDYLATFTLEPARQGIDR
jgi:hypothetical protein